MSGDGGTGSLPVIGWFDEPIKRSVMSVFSGINSKVEALDLFRRYRKAHFDKVRDQVGFVKVLGMSVSKRLQDFYYPTNVSPDIQRRLYEADWLEKGKGTPSRARSKRQRSLDGTEYVSGHDRIVVLGGPGAGKTTFLRYLGLAYTEKDVFAHTKLGKSKFPVFVSLPHLAKSKKSIFDYVADQLVDVSDEYARDFLRRVFQGGMAIFLLDSLDEVPSAHRDDLMDVIKEATSTFVRCKYVVSCRAADYQGGMESFNEVELCPLTTDAVKKIVRSWFANEPESGEKLLSVIDNDSGFSSLTETPLLLSLLCIQYRHDLVLPRRKSEVYKRCVDALLRDWDTSRGFRRDTSYAQLSDEHKERFFENIAGRFLIESKSYIMPTPRLLEVAAEFLPRVGLHKSDTPGVIVEVESHHGIIERYSAESYCFSHASFQEYFAARDAISRRVEVDLVRRHLDDESWLGVIEFIVGLATDTKVVSDIIDVIIAKSSIGTLKNYPAITKRAKLLHLLYRCMVVGPIVDPHVKNKAFVHISESIAGFVKAMSDSGVYPLCSMNMAGLRNPYYFVSKQRPSLHAALLPFRKLLNEINANPLQGYTRVALAYSSARPSPGSIDELAVLLNLLVPIARSSPAEVSRFLSDLIGFDRFAWAKLIVNETLNSIRV